MRSNAQQKMCWNCEGNIQLQEEVCPYCQTHVDQVDNFNFNAPLADTLYPSAHQPSKIIPATSFAIQDEEDHKESPQPKPPENSLLDITVSMALLMGGIIFGIFAVILLVFSSNGKLTLAWNSAYWYLYAFLALPLMFFGWRSLQHFEE